MIAFPRRRERLAALRHLLKTQIRNSDCPVQIAATRAAIAQNRKAA